MKERPIIFSAPMVRAIIEGRKTQTRRVVKNSGKYGVSVLKGAKGPCGVLWDDCPYGAPGDRLWVRETWAPNDVLPLSDRPAGDFIYRADLNHLGQSKYSGRWRSSIHMPRHASRITLEIIGVRVERLQEISDDDCIAEGLEPCNCAEGCNICALSWQEEYCLLWKSIYGPGSWDANPWVWVIQFRRIEQ